MVSFFFLRERWNEWTVLGVMLISLLVLVQGTLAADPGDPVEGSYIGAYLGCGGQDSSCTTIAEFNGLMRSSHSMFVRYIDLSDWADPSHRAWMDDVVNHGAMPLVVYDPGSGLDTIDLQDVEDFAVECGKTKSRVFIAFGHEMNLRYYPWGNQPAKYREKFRAVAEIFHRNAPNVRMCWIPNQNWGYPWGGTDFGNGYSEYYPDGTGIYGEYVDWVGLDFYEKDWDEDDLVPPDMFIANIERGDKGMNFYQTFAIGKQKPMMIMETAAFDPNDDPTQPPLRTPVSEEQQAGFKDSWVSQVYDATILSERFPAVKAICYFHTAKIETIDTKSHQFFSIFADYRIPDTGTYQQQIVSPYFVRGVSAVPGSVNTPTDPDGDGLYEDTNGNGIIDFDDAVVLFWNIQWVQNNEPVSAFDFNGNGMMDFDDAVNLFWQV